MARDRFLVAAIESAHFVPPRFQHRVRRAQFHWLEPDETEQGIAANDSREGVDRRGGAGGRGIHQALPCGLVIVVFAFAFLIPAFRILDIAADFCSAVFPAHRLMADRFCISVAVIVRKGNSSGNSNVSFSSMGPGGRIRSQICLCMVPQIRVPCDSRIRGPGWCGI